MRHVHLDGGAASAAAHLEVEARGARVFAMLTVEPTLAVHRELEALEAGVAAMQLDGGAASDSTPREVEALRAQSPMQRRATQGEPS